VDGEAGRLTGRGALVTGVSRRAGIGHAIANRLEELGASVFRHGWSAHDEAQPWGAEPRVEHFEADLADSDAPAEVIAAARRELGHVDVLVANHARSGHGRLEQLTAEELDGFLAVNVRGTLLLVKEFALQHDDRPGGRVVLLTSGQHLAGMPREVAYAVSKGALHQATATLSAELIPRGITVNTVNPGPTDTGWDVGDPKGHMPLGRWGTPEDAARLVGWLCTDEAAWVTGQVVDSEGGFVRHRF
jgi:3-oxoacyl-[acyl-carrier protein] reductase